MKPAFDPHDDDGIEQAAAAWVLRQDRGLSAVEQDQLSEWLAADPRHGAALARHRQNWERLDQLVRWRPEHSGLPNRDLLAPAPALGWTQHWRWAIPAALAAAAVAAAFFLTGHARPGQGQPAAVTVAAAPDAPIERTLEDGSVVILRPGAALTGAFTKSERRMRLERGEAHFTVAANPSRPFVVTVAGVDIRALGTQFDVRLDPGELQVLVNEGQVRAGSLPLVQAGERAIIPLGAGAAPRVEIVSAAEIGRLLQWRPEQLDFTAAPLSAFVAAFNRHNTVQLIIADPALDQMKLSARLRSDNIDGFVHLLEGGFDIRAERSGDTIRLRKTP